MAADEGSPTSHAREISVLVVVCAGIYLVFYKQTDLSSLFRGSLRLVFLLGFVTLVIAGIQRLCKSLGLQRRSSHHQQAGVNEDVVKAEQERCRQKTQDNHNQKASSYYERILKPRQEAQLEQKEKEFRRFMGPAWKGKGHQLGTEDGVTKKPPKEGSSRDAANARKLPEPPKRAPVAPEPQKIKKVLEVPDEPPEGATNSLVIILRTPQGRNYRRRWLTSHTVQMLLNYITKLGYHQKFYTVFMSYPRCCVSHDPGITLEEAGITSDITLNVQEKDDE